MTKVELFEHIRKSYFNQEKSIRSIAKECCLHRRIVRQALVSAIPAKRKIIQHSTVVLTEKIKAFIEHIIISDKSAPKKQRHTAERIFQRIVVEYGYQGALPTIRKHVGRCRKNILFPKQAFVPQVYQPGKEAEVDWYEAHVNFPWGREKVQIFQMRSCYSGKEFHKAFPHQTQQAFLEAHTDAFTYYGGVFYNIRYDNLTSAVKKVLKGRCRIETERFILLRSHYLFESIFCKPGIEGAHEKGGVEGGVGRFRRSKLVPVPFFESYDEFNQYLNTSCQEDDARVRKGHNRSIKDYWDEEYTQLKALPKSIFHCFELKRPSVNKKGLVSILNNQYSVPIGFVGHQVETRLYAQYIECWKNGLCVAKHKRFYGKNKISAHLDHYLELLHRKPGAFKGSLPLAQAKQQKYWPESYEKLWFQFTNKLGQSAGTRAIVDVLFLHRQYSFKEVKNAVVRALQMNMINVSVIELLVKEHRGGKIDFDPLSGNPSLKSYDRPVCDINIYNNLLRQPPIH